MLISYPVLPAEAISDDEDIYLANILEGHLLQYEGRYPVSTMATAQGPMHRWHGGVHLFGGGEPIRAIADGTVVACRFAADSETYGELGDYDTGFVLLRHETQTGENTTVVFYSLYMHLASQARLAADRLVQLPPWLRHSTGPAVRRPANQRVWRKDVLGFAGQLYNREAMHFEVFMLDVDFNRVWRDSGTVTQGSGSDDWFGDAHFVIPPGQQFNERHPRAAGTGPHRIDFEGKHDFPLPLGRSGQNDETLYVSVSLSKGRRIAYTHRATADGRYERVGAAVVQEEYEYELYRLATALYPDCPSAGLEWLRFGRVLGPDRTARHENWQLIRYSETAIGYVDLAPTSIVKLSDADFPHWLGWEKRDEGETTNAADSVCDDERTLTLSQAADDASTRKVRHLVCKAPSEWDNSDLAARYARLRTPGQSLQNPADWAEFEQHVAKMAFWTEAGLTDRSVWHFHPLQFIRHFGTCGWLSSPEFSQMFPRKLLHLQGTQFMPSITNWTTASSRAQQWTLPFNRAARKYGISSSRQRLVHLISHIIPETGNMGLVVEGAGPSKPYSPYYGRGLIQLTFLSNYRDYGVFRGFSNSAGDGPYASLGWNPDAIIAYTNAQFSADNCADSAGFYVIRRTRMLRHMDRGLKTDDAITVSKDVNGYVAIENLNGLDGRLQSIAYLSNVLMDAVETRVEVPLTFSWRRNSSKETVLDGNGLPVMEGNPSRPKRSFFVTTHTLNVSLQRQRP